MKTLEFRILPRFSIPGQTNESPQIPDKIMSDYQAKINKKFEKYIDALNECGAYIGLSISADGKIIKGDKLMNPTDIILDQMQDDPNLK